MPAGQRGPLSTRGTSEAGGGVPTQSVTSSAAASKPSGGIRSYLAVRLGLANAASCPCLYLQCWFFEVLLVQTGNFMKYGVCKLVLLGSPLGELSPQVTEGFPATSANRFHKELRFFFSLLKRKKEAKKEKSSRCTCTTWQRTTRRLHINKTPPAGHTGGCRRRNTTLFTVEIGA